MPLKRYTTIPYRSPSQFQLSSEPVEVNVACTEQNEVRGRYPAHTNPAIRYAASHMFTWLEKQAHNQTMYSKLTRLITLFALLICLPLQGLAAVTMPSCQMHGQKMAMQADAVAMSHCNHHSKEQPSKQVPCDKCFSCHLSAAQTMIPFNISVVSGGVAPMIANITQEVPDAVPSSLFHPPRTILA